MKEYIKECMHTYIDIYMSKGGSIENKKRGFGISSPGL